jgi:transcriptional regulator of arginine metabolism
LKQKRHEKILEIVERYPIDTQEELLRLLREEGFHVTQATVSRDIKELRLVKTLSADGKYRYVPAKKEAREKTLKFWTLFQESVLSVVTAQNIVCVKCLDGTANAVCAAFDVLHWDSLVGTLAGNDTIFMLCKDEASAAKLEAELNKAGG